MTTMHSDVAMLQAPTTEHAQSQKGSALVEFALILPVFVLLLFGAISYSLALYNKTVLTWATREGARAGALYVKGRTNATAAATGAATASQLYNNNLITFGSGTPTDTSYVDGNNNLIVIAKIKYNGLYVFSSDRLISARTSMMLE